MAGCLVGVLLAGAFLQQYFNYLGGNLYKRDSFKLKCFLHVVIALATVSPPPTGASLASRPGHSRGAGSTARHPLGRDRRLKRTPLPLHRCNRR